MRKSPKATRRKNYFPTLVVIIFLILANLLLVYFVSPQTPGAILVFIILFFFLFLFLFSTLLTSSRRGLLASLTLVTFLLFRYLGVGNIVNFLLLLGVIISFEVYLTKR